MHNCVTSWRMNNAVMGDPAHGQYNNPVQDTSVVFEECLVIPSVLASFINTSTNVETTQGGNEAYCSHGDLYLTSMITAVQTVIAGLTSTTSTPSDCGICVLATG